MKQSEMPRVLMFWTEFLDWLLTTTDRFPKKARFTLTSRIDGLALDVVERLVEARYTKEVVRPLDAANLDLEKMRLLLRLAHRRRYLANKQYEYASRHIDEAGRMMGGWRKAGRQR